MRNSKKNSTEVIEFFIKVSKANIAITLNITKRIKMQTY